MSKANVVEMLERIGLPFAYDHFAEGESPNPPFLVYLYPNANPFSADGSVYHKSDTLHIEVYTDKKDIGLEEKVEETLNLFGFFYLKSETWIPSEKMYEVLYQMEV